MRRPNPATLAVAAVAIMAAAMAYLVFGRGSPKCEECPDLPGPFAVRLFYTPPTAETGDTEVTMKGGTPLDLKSFERSGETISRTRPDGKKEWLRYENETGILFVTLTAPPERPTGEAPVTVTTALRPREASAVLADTYRFHRVGGKSRIKPYWLYNLSVTPPGGYVMGALDGDPMSADTSRVDVKFAPSDRTADVRLGGVTDPDAGIESILWMEKWNFY